MVLSHSPRFNFEEFRGAGRIDDTDSQAVQRCLRMLLPQFKDYLNSLNDSHGSRLAEASPIVRDGNPWNLVERATGTQERFLMCQEAMNLTLIRVRECIKKNRERIEREQAAEKPGLLGMLSVEIFGTVQKKHPLEVTVTMLESLALEIGQLREKLFSAAPALRDPSVKMSGEFLQQCKNAVEKFVQLNG